MAVRRGAIAAALLAMAAGPQWLGAGSLADGSAIEINAAAIVPMRGLVRGWWRLRLMRPRGDGTAILTRLAGADCAHRRITLFETIATRLDGTVVRDERVAEGVALARLAPARPGSADGLAMRALCQMRPARR